MAEVNPYNSVEPGHAFVGYRDELARIISGFRNGKSYAILGGRKCGKTSILLQIESLVRISGVAGFQAFVRLIDLAAQVPRSVFDFFKTILTEIVKETSAEIKNYGSPSSQPYQLFLQQLQDATSHLEARHGQDWLAVLLVDKLDLMRATGDEAFYNLRNLLQISVFKRHVRLVATGGSEIYRQVGEASPLANILDPIWLRCLTTAEASQLTEAGLLLSRDLRDEVFDLSGRHGFVLQGILEYLWEGRDRLGSAALRAATRNFERDRDNVFESWVRVMGPEGTAIYRAVAEAYPSRLTIAEIRNRSRVRNVDESLRVLSFHGIIDDAEDPDRPKIAGTIFRDWFRRNADSTTAVAETTAEGRPRSTDSSKNVFVVHGRDRLRRLAMFEFLRSLGLNPLEWGELVENTGPAPYVGDVLETGFKMAHAAVVLMTGDDEVRLREQFHGDHDELFESTLTPQARPNVLFEAGMAMALFPAQTVLVEVGRLRPMSDILGRHVVRMTNAPEQRKDLARRLRSAGCQIVDLDSTEAWKTAGDFS